MHHLDEFSQGASPGGEGPDSGMSLIEVLVSMVVMSVAMAIFTGGILQTYGAMHKVTSMSSAQEAAAVTFKRMDREMRYASQVNPEWRSGNDYYVEYLMVSSGTSTCVQLRTTASKRTLDRREWTLGTTPPNAWRTVLENVIPANPLSAGSAVVPAVGTVSPFVVIPADADNVSMFQKLQVNLHINVGVNKNASNRQLSVTFTALNSPHKAGAIPVTCNEGRTP